MPISLETLGAGGVVLGVLAILSLLSWTVIIVKLVELRHVRRGQTIRSDALELWRKTDTSAALRLVENGLSPADRVMSFAMKAITGGFTEQGLMSELSRRGNEEVSRMNSKIRLLEIIAMISPLLGLLGTVLGMILSFQELELAQGAANASVLAGGIWQALLTTAAGLLVAIPAAVGAGLLSARIEGATQDIESAVGQLMLAEENPNIG